LIFRQGIVYERTIFINFSFILMAIFQNQYYENKKGLQHLL